MRLRHLGSASAWLAQLAVTAHIASCSWFHPGANEPLGSPSAAQVHHAEQWREDLRAQSLIRLRPVLTSLSFGGHQCGELGAAARMAFFPKEGGSVPVDVCTHDKLPVLSQIEQLFCRGGASVGELACALPASAVTALLGEFAAAVNFTSSYVPSTEEIRREQHGLFEAFAAQLVADRPTAERLSNGFVEGFLDALALEETGDAQATYKAYLAVLNTYEHSQFYLWPPLAEIAALKVRQAAAIDGAASSSRTAAAHAPSWQTWCGLAAAGS